MAAGIGRFNAALPKLRANWRCLWDFVTRRGDELPADVSCFGDGFLRWGSIHLGFTVDA